MIRVLQVLGTTDLGGAESRIMDLYRQMNRKEIQFDFLVHQQNKGYFEDEINQLGGRIYRVPRFKLYNYFSYRKALKNFFKENSYPVVQGHMTSTAAIYLPLAKKAGAKCTIAHARSAGVDQGMKGKLTRFLRRNLWKKADRLFTCSELASVSVFGKEAVNKKEITFIPNAINTQDFAFDLDTRKKIRQELLVEKEDFLIGHVGRFHYAKNHDYMIDIFDEIQKKKPNTKLVLIGIGPLMDEIKEKVNGLGLAEKVIFTGNRTPIRDYYMAMDYFLFPSHFEGLPGSVIEAQASGLRCLVSDLIADEVAITDLVNTKSIDASPGEWADFILKDSEREFDRISRIQDVKDAGFDVMDQAVRMEKLYEKEANADCANASSGRL